MEHIRQYDWCSSQPEINFLNENDMDNCVIERILRNKFREPCVSSDSEDDQPLIRPKILWDDVFRRSDHQRNHYKTFVPALRPAPPFPKISALTKQQHMQCLKVICAENPNILPMEFVPRPTKLDYKVFEEVKEVYLKEQQEFIAWAKILWTSNHCVRALRPKPTTEMVYEAEFKMKATELESFPKNYVMAAHISLSRKEDKYDMTLKEDLINVSLDDLPKVEVPESIIKQWTILRPCPVPEPCNKHPCWFILPKEKSMTVLPLTEIHRELAQYAMDHGAQCIASESALKCLVEMDKDWTMPLSVCQVINADGEKKNVLVFGSEFAIHRKSAVARTHRAFRHLLEYALIPITEKQKLANKGLLDSSSSTGMESLNDNMYNIDVTSDEDDDLLVINEDDESIIDIQLEPTNSKQTEKEDNKKSKHKKGTENNSDTKAVKDKSNDEIESEPGKKKNADGYYTCSCKDSSFENPPPRSFRKWQVKNNKSGDKIDLIVHCSHKMKDKAREVISEPIVEYQIDMGGSRQSEDKLKSLALSLFLRKNASLLNVRIDHCNGDVVTIDTVNLEDLTKNNGNLLQSISKSVYESLSQLQGLLPGHYLLQHEPSHGANAFLYASGVRGSEQKLTLNFDLAVLAEADEAKNLKTPPVMTDVLLPIHKFRKMLPCAFTPFEYMLVKETKKPPAKKKTPPQALRWPKRTRKKNKRR